MDRVVSSLRTAPGWNESERRRRTPFRRLAAMSEGVSPGYMAVVYGKNPLPLFAHIAAFLAMPARMSVGVVCVEHTPDFVMSEIISSVGGIPPLYLRKREVPPPLFATLNIALSRIYDTRLCFSNPIATNMKGATSLARWLKRRYQIKVLMVDSIEGIANARGDRTAVLRTSETLQELCEDLGFCVVATSRTASIYKSLRRGAIIDSDGYDW